MSTLPWTVLKKPYWKRKSCGDAFLISHQTYTGESLLVRALHMRTEGPVCREMPLCFQMPIKGLRLGACPCPPLPVRLPELQCSVTDLPGPAGAP